MVKKNHPKWIEKDEVLDTINSIFENNIGSNYSEEELSRIKKEGKDRYEKKIPPGYKDDKKSEEKKYGDLILWYQIIDKAKETKKPIILISGDVKEDWWLEKNGKRIMPLPQLKKEIFEKAGVDFHIYTSDRFLEYYDNESINKNTINEVRKIRELEEEKIMLRRKKIIEKESDPEILEKNIVKYFQIFEVLERIIMDINNLEISPKYIEELNNTFHKLRFHRNRVLHGGYDTKSLIVIHNYIRDFVYLLNKMGLSEDTDLELSFKLKEYIERLEYLNSNLKYFK